MNNFTTKNLNDLLLIGRILRVPFSTFEKGVYRGYVIKVDIKEVLEAPTHSNLAYINITPILQKKIRIRDLFRTKQMEKVIKYFEEKENVKMVKTVRGKYHSGTWVHRNILLQILAKTKVEIWVDDKVVFKPKKEEKDAQGLYIITDGEFYKIGLANNAKKRLRSMQTGNARKLELVIFKMVNYTSTLERLLHALNRKNRVRGEWFELNDEELERVKSFIIEANADYNNNDYEQIKNNLEDFLE